MKNRLLAISAVILLLICCMTLGAAAEGAVQTITVSGATDWASVAGQIDAGAAAVRITGTGDGAQITFDNANVAELNCSAVFDNLKLSRANNDKVVIFANGHPLEMTESVSTEGNFWLYGGSNGKSVGDTSLKVSGGKYRMICGGSYAADSAASTVYVGPEAEVGCVLGGAHGGVSTGDITVDHASKAKTDFVIGGCGGINGSAEVAAGVNNPNGSIRVTVRSGALVGNVDGADNLTTRCKDIYITVEKGARVLESITGGGNTTSNYGGSALGMPSALNRGMRLAENSMKRMPTFM